MAIKIMMFRENGLSSVFWLERNEMSKDQPKLFLKTLAVDEIVIY